VRLLHVVRDDQNGVVTFQFRQSVLPTLAVEMGSSAEHARQAAPPALAMQRAIQALLLTLDKLQDQQRG
jgi:hypothetical protein